MLKNKIELINKEMEIIYMHIYKYIMLYMSSQKNCQFLSGVYLCLYMYFAVANLQ